MSKDISCILFMVLYSLPFIYLRYRPFLHTLRLGKPYIIATILTMLAIYIGYYYYNGHNLTVRMGLVFSICTFLYSLIAIRATLCKQLFVFAIVASYEMVLVSIAIIIDDILTPESTNYAISNILLIIGLLLSYRWISHSFDKHLTQILENEKPAILWIASLSTLMGFFGSAMLNYPFTHTRHVTLLGLRGIVLLVCFICIILTVRLYYLRQNFYLKGALRTAGWMHASEKQVYDLVMHSWNESRRQRHDLRHNLLAIRQLLTRKDYDEIARLLEPSLHDMPPVVKENDLFRDLLHYWHERAMHYHIQWDLSDVATDLTINDPDIVIFISALLKDAVTAAETAEAAAPEIRLSLYPEYDSIPLSIAFSCNETLGKLYSDDVIIWQRYTARTNIDKYSKTMRCRYEEGLFYFTMTLGNLVEEEL